MKIITDIKKLNAEIASLGKLNNGISVRNHCAAASCVVHFLTHGNVTPALNLFEAMGRGSNRVSLVDWFKKFCIGITWDKEVGTFKVAKIPQGFGELLLRFQTDPAFMESLEKPFYLVGADPAKLMGFSVKARLAALLKQAEALEASIDEEKYDKAKVDLTGLAELRAMQAVH